jgi:hypothetical protein
MSWLATLSFLILALAISPARADDCDSYRQAAASGGIPTTMLADQKTAIGCLFKISTEQSPQSGTADANTTQSLIQATGALDRLLDQAGPGDNSAIRAMRASDNLAVISALSYDARGTDKQLRLNSTAILANIIDNTTVCVALDHLADPNISDSGRINLLGVASVVAPWASAETYENLGSAAKYFETITAKSPDLDQTKKAVAALETRLGLQTGANATKNAPRPDLTKDCSQYQPLWANSSAQTFTLTYPGATR